MMENDIILKAPVIMGLQYHSEYFLRASVLQCRDCKAAQALQTLLLLDLVLTPASIPTSALAPKTTLNSAL